MAAATDDETLVARAAAGDTQAFEALVVRYQDRLFNLLARQCGSENEAEDLVQETFLKAYRALGSFRRGAQFYTWLFRIALNTAYSRGRQVVRRQRVEGVSLDDPAPGGHSETEDEGSALGQRLASQQTEAPLNSLEREHVRQRVREGLEEISEEHRAVLLLRDIEGLDYDEIAETLELTRAAVKSRLHRARLEMARILRDLRPEPRTATVDGRT